MIKTRYFHTDNMNHPEIDAQLNRWFNENPNIDLIDIKYGSNVSAVADCGVSGTYDLVTALVVYKENKDD